MDDWKPNDPKVLEFDLNLCTAREFCEVFGMDASMARMLQEYRQEALHVFKFEQLLKLKGITAETLQQWSNPQSNGDFDRELQRALKLQADTPEPLPSLLDGICKLTGASGGLMAARNGGMMLQSVLDGASFESLAPEIPEFIRPVQEDMIQMQLGTAGLQVIGFQSVDLIFVPASAFYIAATQPRGNLTSSTLSLWLALAAEVRRRYPSKIYINNHAPVTENDVAFDCPKCLLRLVVDRVGIGYTFPCPRCKTNVTVPEETTSFSSFVTAEQIGQASS